MTISFQLPAEIEKSLRRELVDLDQVAKQALAVEAFRSGKLSLGQFAEILGLSSYEADGFLKQRGCHSTCRTPRWTRNGPLCDDSLLNDHRFRHLPAPIFGRCGRRVRVAETVCQCDSAWLGFCGW